MTRAQMKKVVKEKLNNHFGFFFVLFLPYFILYAVGQSVSYTNVNVNTYPDNFMTGFYNGIYSSVFSLRLTFLFEILAGLALVGIMYVCIDVARNKDDYLHGFHKSSTILKGGYLLPAICIGFLTYLFTFLWMFLLIIPGIIKSLAYSQAQYIYRDALDRGEKIGYLEAITRSRQLMDGHKWEFFILNLSFIWWYLLVGITAGIAGFYVFPYVQLTFADYYNQLVENADNQTASTN